MSPTGEKSGLCCQGNYVLGADIYYIYDAYQEQLNLTKSKQKTK